MFRSVGELEDAIRDYLDQHNTNPKGFVWTRSAQTVLEKERRKKNNLDQIQLGVSDVRLLLPGSGGETNKRVNFHYEEHDEEDKRWPVSCLGCWPYFFYNSAVGERLYSDFV